MGRSWTFVVACLFLCSPALAQVGTSGAHQMGQGSPGRGSVQEQGSQAFSLFGVKLGMTRQEVEQKWPKLDDGSYYVKDSVLFAVRPEFDHRDRLYRISFSAPLGDRYDSYLAATAYQSLVNTLWGSNPRLAVNFKVGAGFVETTVASKELSDELLLHVRNELSVLLKP